MSNLKNVTALILVGGLGTRLRAVIGDDTPKPLALIDRQPFLQRLLQWLSVQGIREVILGTGHLADSFEQQLQEFTPEGMNVRFSREETPLGTGGAIKNALSMVTGSTLLVLNGDSVASVDLAELLGFHVETNADATLALVQVPDAARFGTVHTNAKGLITEFIEKTGSSAPGSINAGMYLLSKTFFATFPSDAAFSLERDVLPQHCNKNIFGKSFQGDFIDIGTPESYSQASDFFKRFSQ